MGDFYSFIYQTITKLFGEALPAADLLEIEIGGREGDVTMKVFRLAKHIGKPVGQVALEIVDNLKHPNIVQSAVVGGFINLTLDPVFLKQSAVDLAVTMQHPVTPAVDGESIMIEYLSPNTNKPLHLGHVRNGVLGMALAQIVSTTGKNVITSQIINDRGVHICKSMLAWRLWGNGQTPQDTNEKPDHFVGRWYVEFSKRAVDDPTLEAQAQELLRQWEAGDEQVLADWKLMNGWFMEGFRQTCQTYGFTFDVEFFESNTYKLGKQVVEEGLSRGVFYKNDVGQVVIDLPEEEFGLNEDGSAKVLTVLREDGTGVYLTQDIGTAKTKFDQYHMDQSWHVVGAEQKYYFQCLFYVLEKLGFGLRDKLKHCSYGMVYLPEGKMKSREGTVVDADDLLATVVTAVKTLQAESAHASKSLSSKEVQAIALAAIKFYLLRVNPDSDIYFDPKESVSLDGFTGTYCLYTHVRLQTLFEKAGFAVAEVSKKPEFLPNWLHDGFKDVTLLMLQYPGIVQLAAATRNPSLLCKFTFDLCQAVNNLYETQPVLTEIDPAKKQERLELFALSAAYIKQALSLLSIQTVAKM